MEGVMGTEGPEEAVRDAEEVGVKEGWGVGMGVAGGSLADEGWHQRGSSRQKGATRVSSNRIDEHDLL